MVDVLSAMIKESKSRSGGSDTEEEETEAREIAKKSYNEIFGKE